jgi:MFS family permease
MPYVVGLSICAGAMVVIGLAGTLGAVLAGLIVTSLGAGLCFAPAMTMISDIAESSGLHQGFAAGLSNMAWASGQVVGGIGGGVVASLTGNAVPSIAIAILLALTVGYAFRSLGAGPGSEPRPAAG